MIFEVGKPSKTASVCNQLGIAVSLGMFCCEFNAILILPDICQTEPHQCNLMNSVSFYHFYTISIPFPFSML